MILAAQEDLRRDIARAMHDGPAQSLTNIVLQAQIVERLIASDPAAARPETRELIAMVQSTLDATKSFIFDVRPMVLDDLGLVPTVRRSARDRGRRAGIPVDFDSMGTDRRLPMELESGVFRMLEESLAGYLAGSPGARRRPAGLEHDHARGGRPVRPRARSRRADGRAEIEAAESSKGGRLRGRAKPEPELPAALAAMIDERRGRAGRGARGGHRADRPAGQGVARRPGAGRDPRRRGRAVGRRIPGPDHRRPAASRLTARSAVGNTGMCRPAPHGQGLVEYGIVLALSALVIVVLLVFFDDQVAAVLGWLSNQLP